jgi:predicted membrane-bound spermidine synthase
MTIPGMPASGKRGIYLLAFLEGLSVLGIELLGGKIISAYYGSSYVVWTAVLGVTLLALALGYYTGGALSAKKDLKSVLFNCIVIGSVLTALMPVSAGKVFGIVSDYSLYSGLLTSAVLILAPPLAAIGSTTSILVQLLSAGSSSAGTYSGRVYTLSTLGAITATFITGYYAIGHWGVTRPLLFIALALLAAAFILLYSRKKLIPGLISLAIFVLAGTAALNKLDKKSSRSFKVQYESEGVLGQLKVLDQHPEGQNFWSRRLLINGIPQTFILNTSDAYSFWHYPHFISTYATMKDTSSSVLLIGLGGGSVARELMQQKFKFDAVELDERIVPVAKKYFYLDTDRMNVTIGDARHFIRKAAKKYDMVIMDVLSGEVQPNHVFTMESLAELKNILAPKGMVIINYQGILNDPDDKAFGALYHTFTASGFHTYYWATNPDAFDDIVFVISNDTLDFSKIDRSRLNPCCNAPKVMDRFLRNPVIDEKRTFEDVELLTDNKPVLERLNHNAMVEWRKVMMKEITNPELEEGISLFK